MGNILQSLTDVQLNQGLKLKIKVIGSFDGSNYGCSSKRPKPLEAATSIQLTATSTAANSNAWLYL